jgi:hypothetical protein
MKKEENNDLSRLINGKRFYQLTFKYGFSILTGKNTFLWYRENYRGLFESLRVHEGWKRHPLFSLKKIKIQRARPVARRNDEAMTGHAQNKLCRKSKETANSLLTHY